MTKRASYLILSGIGMLSAFAIGYWQGQNHVMLSLSKDKIEWHSSTINPSPRINPTIIEEASQSISTEPDSDSLAPSELTLQSSHSETQGNDGLINVDKRSPIALLEYLLFITDSDNVDDMKYFSKTIDALRELVSERPENIAVLMEYFIDAPADSRLPYYITSVLQSATIDNKSEVMAEIVQRLSLEGTSEAEEKMLHLLSNTGITDKNGNTVDAVKNVALYAASSNPNKLFALELLMPYQLTHLQKQKVVEDLRFALNSAREEEKSYLVENIMRYSNKEQRQQMASDFLQNDYDFSTRIAILSSIHSGTLTPSEGLKRTLFTIAQNNSDPLNQHAKHAILSSFDIDNTEYELLSGQH